MNRGKHALASKVEDAESQVPRQFKMRECEEIVRSRRTAKYAVRLERSMTVSSCGKE